MGWQWHQSKKVKYPYICIALYHDSSLKRSGMAHVNEGSRSFTCHPHLYPQMDWAMPAFTPQLQSITALWLVLISRPAEGRRLSWPRLAYGQLDHMQIICTLLHCSRQITMPASHHSIFCRPDAFDAAQPTVLKQLRQTLLSRVKCSSTLA